MSLTHIPLCLHFVAEMVVWSFVLRINDGGIRIDDDHTAVSVGVGSLWNNNYAKLDPINITIRGCRVAGIGVGGFLVGGQF